MKVYITYKPFKLEDQIESIARTGMADIPYKGFGLRAIDFGDGLLNLKTDAYEKNKDRIHEFMGNNFVNFIKKIEEQNVMELYDEDDEMGDNIIEIDTDKKTIHFGYVDEFGL